MSRGTASRFKTAEEVGEILKLGTSTIYRLIAKGEIKAIKIGGSVRVPDRELDRLQRGETGASD